LIYDTSNSGVYLVNNRGRYHLSPTMCTAWGLSCSDSNAVKSLGNTFQAGYLNTGFELDKLAASGGVIYEMVNGQRLPIANPKTLNDLGFQNIPILITSTLNSSSPLGPLLNTVAGVIQFSPSPSLYYYDGSTYYSIPDMSIYTDWLLQAVPGMAMPTSSYNTTPPNSTNLTDWY
jgi:hypothetical protein